MEDTVNVRIFLAEGDDIAISAAVRAARDVVGTEVSSPGEILAMQDATVEFHDNVHQVWFVSPVDRHADPGAIAPYWMKQLSQDDYLAAKLEFLRE